MAGVAGEQGGDEAVVGELDPGHAAALIGADEVGVDEGGEDAVLEALGAGRAAQDLGPQAAVGDEVAGEPGAEEALWDGAVAGDGGELVVAVGGEGLIDVADGGEVGDVDLGCPRGQARPQGAAGDLQLDGLDAGAGLEEDAAVGLGDPDLAQVVDELAGGGVAEADVERGGGALDGGEGGGGAEQVEAVAGAQAGREEVAVGVEGGEPVLAQGEHGVAVAAAQGGAELAQEGDLGGAAGGVDGQELLELVEDQDLGVAVAAAAIEVVGEGHTGEGGEGGLPVLWDILLEAEQDAEGEAVGAVDRRGQADAGDREDGEALGAQARDQAGVQEGALAGAGGGVQEDDALGDDEVDEVGELAVAGVEPLAGREGAWTDVRVGVRTRTHDQTSGLHCIRGQGASGAVAWGVEARGREGWRAGARGV